MKMGHVLLKLATAHFPSGGFQEATTLNPKGAALTGVTADFLYIKYLKGKTTWPTKGRCISNAALVFEECVSLVEF